ncbi:MAG: diguanylate cyclase, partial [Clostridia bacterium]|nr:diguanylate cyclase [Clostridia bacterium]
METLLYSMILVILLLTIELGRLLYKNHKISKQLRDYNNEGFWHKVAITDELTGIYNRTAYSEHIAELEKSHTFEHLGIALFDVDNFKEINDKKGHLEGDEILKFVAKSIKSVFTPPTHY